MTRLLHEAGGGGGHGGGGERVVARALELLLLDLLVDEVLRVADGGGGAADGDDAVARAGRERALLADLDVGARHLLDLHQAAPARTCHTHPSVALGHASLLTILHCHTSRSSEQLAVTTYKRFLY